MVLFWKKGYADTSLVDLEKALQVKAPSIYSTFGSKHTLFLEAIRHYIQHVVVKRLQDHITTAIDPIAGIKAFFTSTLVAAHDKKTGSPGCLLTNSATEFGADTPDIAALVTAGLQQTETVFKQALTAVHGDIQDVDRLAAALLMEFQGLMVLTRLNYNQSTIEAAIDAVIQKLR